MAKEIVMPKLGLTMTEGTIESWYKKEGEAVQEGEKLVSIGAGGYGTKDGAKRLFAFYDSINDKIRSECNPQEVYVYEYNNHECCIDWDGDLNAIRIIATVWGEDVARTIKRKNACYPIESIFK